MSLMPTSFSTDFSPVTGAPCAIIVPCYNEAERLDAKAFMDYLMHTPDVHFVFVNDGSRDQTLVLLTELKNAAPGRVTVLSLAQNSGKAEAVRQGLLHASERGFEFLGYWDADLATPLDAIEDFLKVGRKLEDVTVVFGSRRALLGHRIERTAMRRAVSRACAMLARQAVRLPIGDTQCGAKLLRNTKAVRAALAEPFTAGWLFDVELFARISKKIGASKWAFYELPLLEWDEVAGSKVSSSAIVKSGFRMLRLIAENRLGVPALQNSTSLVPTVHEIDAPAMAELKLAA